MKNIQRMLIFYYSLFCWESYSENSMQNKDTIVLENKSPKKIYFKILANDEILQESSKFIDEEGRLLPEEIISLKSPKVIGKEWPAKIILALCFLREIEIDTSTNKFTLAFSPRKFFEIQPKKYEIKIVNEEIVLDEKYF